MSAVTGQLVIDEQLAGLIDYMERNVPADQLERTARDMASLAPLLWSEFRCVRRYREPIRGMQPSANGSAPAELCAGGGSAVGAGAD